MRYRLLPSESELANRKEVIHQLCNAKVYTAEKVSVQWTLKTLDSSLEVVGRVDSGRVKVTAVNKALEIFLREDDANSSRPPFELQEELTTFCDIKEVSQVALLQWVVSEPDIDEIEAIFKRRGLHNDVPEFDALVESLNRGQNPHFWDKLPSSLDPKDKRHYHGKSYRHTRGRKSQEAEFSALDAVQSFMTKFNKAISWGDIATKPWKEVRADTMLSHLCRLENVDPYSLLPQNKSSWRKRIQRGGAFPDDAVGFFYKKDPLLHKKTRFLRPTQLFPAAVEIRRDGAIVVSVSPNATPEVGDETLLAGEVYVCF
jgi:hypothetical protein